MSDHVLNNDERSESTSTTPSVSDVNASPISIPLLYSNRSGTSTPESEVESSLAYKGTQRYSAKSRQGKRKVKKKKVEEKVESKDEQEDDKDEHEEEERSAHATVLHLERTEDNCKYTQTQTNFLDDTVDEIFDVMRCDKMNVKSPTQTNLKKNVRSSTQTNLKKKVKSSTQTNLKWFELENILNRDIDEMGVEDLKGMINRLKSYICDKDRSGESEHVIYSLTTENAKHDIPEVRLDEPIADKTSSDENISSSESTFDTTTNTVESLIAPAKKREHTLSDAEVDPKEKEKKVSIGGSDPPPTASRRTSLAVDNTGKKRISSAHCIGNRRETLDMGQTVIDLFKAQGEELKKEEPSILKYVGEKPNVSPSTSEMTHISSSSAGWHEGMCQFCGKELLCIPTLEQIQDPGLAEFVQYCCASFKHFITLFLTCDDEESAAEDEIIDVRPNAPYGSKKHRKAARERAADRQRERELEKQKAAAQQANLFSFARQMKTIQYSLASRKYMQEGWTIIPSSPPPSELNKDENLFQVEVNSTLLQTAGVLVNKTYDNGKPFLNIFPDGTGCCYYPSGHVAVIITSTEKGKYTYIVQTNKGYNDLEDNGLLAIFQPNGNSVCYYKRNQKIRTYINAFGGVELDPKGRKKKRWQWYMIKGHVHTPPFHPLCFSLNKYISVRILNQQNIALSFSSQRRSVRFNVGAQLKALSIRNRSLFGGDDPAEIYLNEKRRKIAKILTNLHSAVRLPKSARDGPYPTTSQKKKEKLEKIMLTRTQLPPIADKQAVIIN